MTYRSINEGGPKVDLQALIYPGVVFNPKNMNEYMAGLDFFELNDKKSRQIVGESIAMLSGEGMSGFIKTSSADFSHKYYSPLLHDNFTDLPPTLIITGEFDPLRIQDELYGG